jgi:hypothetical protein
LGGALVIAAANILGEEAMAHPIAQSLCQQIVSVPAGARRYAGAQRGVPRLNVDGAEALQADTDMPSTAVERLSGRTAKRRVDFCRRRQQARTQGRSEAAEEPDRFPHGKGLCKKEDR